MCPFRWCPFRCALPAAETIAMLWSLRPRHLGSLQGVVLQSVVLKWPASHRDPKEWNGSRFPHQFALKVFARGSGRYCR
jgi:hypothetical protein